MRNRTKGTHCSLRALLTGATLCLVVACGSVQATTLSDAVSTTRELSNNYYPEATTKKAKVAVQKGQSSQGQSPTRNLARDVKRYLNGLNKEELCDLAEELGMESFEPEFPARTSTKGLTQEQARTKLRTLLSSAIATEHLKKRLTGALINLSSK